MKLTPLSAWGKGTYVPLKGKVDPSIDMKAPPPALVDKMDVAAFFGRFAELLKDNPPNAVDYPMIHRLERAGFKVGQSFNLATAPASIRQAFERGYADGKALVLVLVLAEGKKAAGIGGKGWIYTTRGGSYGVDYEYRAAVANFGLGMNLPQDAVYPSLSSDSEGRPLDGNSKYVLHFDKGKLPPVDAFWSVTAYDIEGYFIPNTLKRQAIGDRDKLVTPTARSTSTSRRTRRGRRRKPIGSRSAKRRSPCSCASIRHARNSSRATGRRRSCACLDVRAVGITTCAHT